MPGPAQRVPAPGSSSPASTRTSTVLPAAGPAAQRERHLAPLEHRPLDLLHLVDLHLLDVGLLEGARVDGDVRPVPEPADGLFEARDLLLLGHVAHLLTLQLDLARERVRGVGAGPDADAAAVQLGDRA